MNGMCDIIRSAFFLIIQAFSQLNNAIRNLKSGTTNQSQCVYQPAQNQIYKNICHSDSKGDDSLTSTFILLKKCISMEFCIFSFL